MGDQRSRQQGSLHAVVIAVLFVSLMAALGVVFYQNFVAKKEVVIEQPKAQEEKPLIERIAFNSEIYSLEYPKDWKVTTKETEGANGKATIVTNKNKTVEVVFIIADTTSSDPCDVNDGLKISAYNVDQSPVTKLTSAPLYHVETIFDVQGGGYFYTIGLVPDGGSTHAAIGESRCNVQLVGLASASVVQNGKIVTPHISANIIFPGLLPKDDIARTIAVKDMKQIKDMMNTDEYKTAVKILKSARKE